LRRFGEKGGEFSRKARQLDLPWTWPRLLRPTIDKRGLLREAATNTERERLSEELLYDPFTQRELPNALAKVVDRRSALRFARRHGRLGYTELLEGAYWRGTDALIEEKRQRALLEDLGTDVGDPLEWMLAQAKTVCFVMELVVALQEGDEDATGDVLVRRRAGRRVEPLGEGEFVRNEYLLARGPQVSGNFFSPSDTQASLYPDAGPFEEARRIILDMLEANTTGVGWRWRPHLARGVAMGHSARALIEVIWWHVGTAAAAGTDETVRLCKLETCRAPFIVTDDRQHFCPADYVYTHSRTGEKRRGRSRCAALYVKRHGGGKG
jgi:hypothetical protein